jgi:hypothetical protein
LPHSAFKCYAQPAFGEAKNITLKQLEQMFEDAKDKMVEMECPHASCMVGLKCNLIMDDMGIIKLENYGLFYVCFTVGYPGIRS